MSKTRLRTTVKKQRGGADSCKVVYPELYKYVNKNNNNLTDILKKVDSTQILITLFEYNINTHTIKIPDTTTTYNIQSNLLCTTNPFNTTNPFKTIDDEEINNNNLINKIITSIKTLPPPPPTTAEINNYNNVQPQSALQATYFPKSYSSSPEYSS